MNETDLRNQFLNVTPMFKAWGDYVASKIYEDLKVTEKEYIIKIPIKPRVKEVSSFLEKALYRGKNYINPIQDITDIVGIRLVVLLTSDIKAIEEIVKNQSEYWNFSKDRDFETEKEENPSIFGYQSVHYVVKNVRSFEYDGVTIEKNIPCEIQIRTLLQHAYSEVTHDTIYKPSNIPDSKMIRKIARSMALMESADENFTQVFEELAKMKIEKEEILIKFRKKYETFNSYNFNEKLSILLFNTFAEEFKSINDDEFNDFLIKNRFLQDKIIERSKNNLLFSQPIILGLYYLIENYHYKVNNLWPLPIDELTPLFVDLGKAIKR